MGNAETRPLRPAHSSRYTAASERADLGRRPGAAWLDAGLGEDGGIIGPMPADEAIVATRCIFRESLSDFVI
jgi:hypothetical protein